MAIKKLTPEYVEAQTLPFEAWYHGMDEKPIKAIVMQYNTYAGASVKTIEWRLVGEDGQSPHVRTRNAVGHLFQDKQSVLEKFALDRIEMAESPGYDELLEQRNKMYTALYNITGSYVPTNDDNYNEAVEALKKCKLTHREDRIGLLK